ncbi:MFS transporter [Novosphingobium terrae]|uniref:MFS transporter n=1 Tax=Novosphingobium terrae TaxID=2726189 RepID=UPI00197E1CBD|nr:MFS transporter [Novosphingobium terrae]
MSASLPRRALFPALILLVGLNLRPILASIGPLLDQIQCDTGLTDSQASLLTSLPVMLMGLCLLGAARVRALLGERGGIALGLTAIMLACLARWQWATVPALLVTAVIGGFGIAIVQALMPSLLRHHAGDRAPAMMGLYSTAIMGGAALASFAAPRIASTQGWLVATGIWALPAVLAIAAWWLASPPPQKAPQGSTATRIWGNRRAWRLLGFFGLGTGAYTLVLAWLPPYYTGLGWSARQAGAMLAALTLAEVVAGLAVSFGVGRFADRRPMILLAIAALLAGMLCLCLAPLTLAWAAAGLAGLGIGALFPLGLIVAMDHGESPAQAGQIAGFVQGGGYLLAALLPLLAGVIRQNLSDLTPAWWLMAALCLLLAVLAAGLRPGDRLSPLPLYGA